MNDDILLNPTTWPYLFSGCEEIWWSMDLNICVRYRMRMTDKDMGDLWRQ